MDDIPTLISVISVVISFIIFISSVYFNYWLRKWQYRKEYAIRNVERIYIPLLAEINEKLPHFDDFLEAPEGLSAIFPELEKIYSCGLSEFIRIDDKKLFGDLEHFYTSIYPRLRELDNLTASEKRQIFQSWERHLKGVLDENAAKEANNYMAELIMKVWVPLLKRRDDEVTDAYNVWLARFKWKPPDETIQKLIDIAKPRTKKITAFYASLETEIHRIVLDKLVPQLQKHISKPI